MSNLTCFKAYDVRGEIGVNIDEDVAYRIGRAVAQHFSSKSVVIGFDARGAWGRARGYACYSRKKERPRACSGDAPSE